MFPVFRLLTLWFKHVVPKCVGHWNESLHFSLKDKTSYKNLLTQSISFLWEMKTIMRHVGEVSQSAWKRWKLHSISKRLNVDCEILEKNKLHIKIVSFANLIVNLQFDHETLLCSRPQRLSCSIHPWSCNNVHGSSQNEVQICTDTQSDATTHIPPAYPWSWREL